MGCLVHAGILKEDKTLTDTAKENFIREVKELLVYGSANLPTPVPFPCGEPMLPPNPPLRMEDFPLEDEKLYESFHRDIIKNQYEKTVAPLDVEPTFSLLPALADPIALASAFGVELPPVPFPDGFVPYLTGLLVPKFFLDLLKAGITDFVIPVQLIPELTKLISVPQVPTIPALPPIELPPIVVVPEVPTPPFPPDLPAAEIPALPLPEVPAPPTPPAIALADVYLKDLALLEGIPKLIAEIISEIPKLISKIVNLPELFAYICGKVRDSGIFGQSAPENDLEKAASIVLARKISECIFYVSIAKTLGSGYGSLNASIAKTNNNKPPEKKPATAGDNRRPSEILREFAEGSAGLSYGGAATSYVDRLVYYEMILSKMPPNAINLYGEPVEGKPLEGTTRKMILSDPSSYAIEQPRGFAVWADYAASAFSSCGLFARACLYTAGANNEFFLSQYTDQTAVSGIILLGQIKNFEWVKVDEQTGVPTLNTELVELSKKYTEVSNWYGNTIPDDLKKHLKPINKRAMIGFYDLQALAKEGAPLPDLAAGDVFIVAKYEKQTKKEGAKPGEAPAAKSGGYVQKNEHVSVVVNPVTRLVLPPSTDITSAEDRLDQSIVTIDGGQIDDKNLNGAAAIGGAPLLEKSAADADFKKSGKKTAGGGTQVVVGNYTNHYFFEGTGAERRFYKLVSYDWRKNEPHLSKLKADSTYSPPKNTSSWDNYTFQDVTQFVASGAPTAILNGEYDVGVCVKKELGGRVPGYWLGKSTLYTVGGNKFESKPDKDGRLRAYNNNIRMVLCIIKTDNFLDQFETGNVENEEQAKVIFDAISAQDSLPFIKELTKVYKTKLELLAPVCFPSVPKGDED